MDIKIKGNIQGLIINMVHLLILEMYSIVVKI